jgi:hypothetical protein
VKKLSVARVYAQYKKPSAYRSGVLVKVYKELGGRYEGGSKASAPLSAWFKERWTDLAPEGQYPVYRPTVRVNKDTPLTVSEIDPGNLKKQIKLKQVYKGDRNLPAFKKHGGGVKDNAKFSGKEKLEELKVW